MKKSILVIISIGIFALLIGCGGGEKNPFLDKKQNTSTETPHKEGTDTGKVEKIAGGPLYMEKCTACHGNDGNLGVGGAKKISESTLNQQEREELIANGKKTMPAFKEQLSGEEIKAIAEYSFTLK